MSDLQQAITMIKTIRAGKARWGKQYSHKPEFTDEQLYDAISQLDTVVEAVQEEGKEERTKLNRQLGAAKARETKLIKRLEDLKVEK
jgi:hypothetical protein